jgi:hypothetical protein
MEVLLVVVGVCGVVARKEENGSRSSSHEAKAGTSRSGKRDESRTARGELDARASWSQR